MKFFQLQSISNLSFWYKFSIIWKNCKASSFWFQLIWKCLCLSLNKINKEDNLNCIQFTIFLLSKSQFKTLQYVGKQVNIIIGWWDLLGTFTRHGNQTSGRHTVCTRTQGKSRSRRLSQPSCWVFWGSPVEVWVAVSAVGTGALATAVLGGTCWLKSSEVANNPTTEPAPEDELPQGQKLIGGSTASPIRQMY